jgi:DNA-binding NarL/FixJ family response regulator
MAAAIVNQTGKAILLMRSYGKSDEEIAGRLKITPHEVEEGFFTAALELRARTPAHAIARAIKAGLLPLRPRAATLKKLGIKDRR